MHPLKYSDQLADQLRIRHVQNIYMYKGYDMFSNALKYYSNIIILFKHNNKY